MIKNVSGMRIFAGSMAIESGATINEYDKLPAKIKSSVDSFIKMGLLVDDSKDAAIKETGTPVKEAPVTVISENVSADVDKAQTTPKTKKAKAAE